MDFFFFTEKKKKLYEHLGMKQMCVGVRQLLMT